MASHEYSPRQALALLLRKVRERDPDLAIGLEAVIDAGKDVFLPTAKERRKYLKTVQFTDEQALDIALQALRAHFVEQPRLATSAMSEFGKAVPETEGNRRDEESFSQSPSEYEPHAIRVEFELQTETQVAPKGDEAVDQTVPLSPPEKEFLDEQQANVDRLTALLRFEEGESWQQWRN